jgi:hypothetical protein
MALGPKQMDDPVRYTLHKIHNSGEQLTKTTSCKIQTQYPSGDTARTATQMPLFDPYL